MADPRFFTRHGPFSLAKLAEATGAVLARGNPDQIFEDLGPLETANASQVSFLDNVKYISAFEKSAAGASLVREKFAARAPEGMALLVTEEPYTAFAKIAWLFYPVPFEPFVSPHAHIGKNAQIGARCRIEASAWIGDGVVIGDDCHIGSNVVISHALIGDRCHIHPNVSIGQDGFGFTPSKTGILKVPQLGRVIIGSDVEIGAGTCIDRGSGPDTIIGDFCKLDNMVHIAHNCVLGKGVMLAGMVGLAGSTRLEDYVQMGGQVGSAGHITIGKGARIAAKAGIMSDVPPGETWGGFPAQPIREWHRQTVMNKREKKA